ncbi:MAG: amidase [Betaproteobacteria bacterium]|nr:amidase [Betaproteobacteria bacterium]
MSDLHNLTLAEASAAIQARRVSAVELLQAQLTRARAVQPAINAFIRIDEEQALAQAHALDAQAARGHFLGPLHGVPMAHKDMFYRTGLVTSCGSAIRCSTRTDTTATALQRLDAAGAVDFGTLNMAEFAYGPTGHNVHFGAARNPWNTAHITGGSSSGSGAAVAARACFGALGSDTGGSVRLPASLCGVTGLKVTYGRVSRAGAMPLSYSMDTIGPLARTALDCAMMLQVLAGPDPRDPTTPSQPVPEYLNRLRQPLGALRVGIPNQFFHDDLDPAVARCIEDARRTLASLGYRLVPVDIPDMRPAEVAATHVIAAEAAALHGNWLRNRPGEYSPQVRARLMRGLAVPAPRYIDALRLRGELLQRFLTEVFSQVDVLHLPSLAIPTPTLAETDVGGGERMDRILALLTRLQRPLNFLGLPSIALPCGFAGNNVPVGMQIAGRPFAEDVVLHLAHAFQQATDWHARQPALA